jgi:catechol 2,3-dioxygenase-like lactoylglutathione lyase family enzyme
MTSSSTSAPFAVKSIDHVVLTVKDIDATVEFYTSKLGMRHEKFVSKGQERYAIPRPSPAPCSSFSYPIPSLFPPNLPQPPPNQWLTSERATKEAE